MRMLALLVVAALFAAALVWLGHVASDLAFARYGL